MAIRKQMVKWLACTAAGLAMLGALAACGGGSSGVPSYLVGCVSRPVPAKAALLVDTPAPGAPRLEVAALEAVIDSAVKGGGTIEARSFNVKQPPVRATFAAMPPLPATGHGTLKDKAACDQYKDEVQRTVAANAAVAQGFRNALAGLLAAPGMADNPWPAVRETGAFLEQQDAAAGGVLALLVVSNRETPITRCLDNKGLRTVDPGASYEAGGIWWICNRAGEWVELAKVPKNADGTPDLGQTVAYDPDIGFIPLPKQAHVAVLKASSVPGFLDGRAEQTFVDTPAAVAWLSGVAWPKK